MSLFAPRPVTPTLNERINAAEATANAALSAFEVTAQELEHAAIELDEANAEATAERRRLVELETVTRKGADQRREQAANIRKLIG